MENIKIKENTNMQNPIMSDAKDIGNWDILTMIKAVS